MNTERFAKAMEELGASVAELTGSNAKLELQVPDAVLKAFTKTFQVSGQPQYEISSYVVEGAEITLKGK
jgi:hypothetical protein